MKCHWNLIVGLLLVCQAGLAQQQQQIADSLRRIYEADTLEGPGKMDLLENLAYHEMNDPERALAYADELISLAREAGNNGYLYRGHLQKGHTLLVQNNLGRALESYQAAMEYARKDGNKMGEATALMYQGSVYYDSGEPDRATDNLLQSIAIFRDPEIQAQEEGTYLLAAVLTNLGNIHLQENELDEAGEYLSEAGEIYKRLNSRSGLNYVLGNQGIVYAKLGEYDKAEENLTQAIRQLEEDRNYAPIAEYQITLAEVYGNTGDFVKAHTLATVGLEHAQRLGFKELISRASLLLAGLDYRSKNFREAYEHLDLHMQFKDSMDVETVSMNRLIREKAELEALQTKNELELQSLKQKRQEAALWAVGVTALLLIILAAGTYGRYRFVRKTNKIISRERDRSEGLLLNILPRETAQELKTRGRVQAKRFEAVTVLFTDFKGFTKHAESMDPEMLLESLDYYFGRFDAVMDKYGLEKIKTVGDAYMCACGLPFPVGDHAEKVVQAALEMLEIVEAAKGEMSEEHPRYDIRIGINSGPVVAGVVGTKKFAYDIWGDTVNIASRMESASEIGQINIADGTYQLIKDAFECRYRGSIAVKNHEELDMYFVLGRKESASADKTMGASSVARG